jgi:hypothetical protein
MYKLYTPILYLGGGTSVGSTIINMKAVKTQGQLNVCDRRTHNESVNQANEISRVVNLYAAHGKERTHSAAVNRVLFIHLEALYVKNVQDTTWKLRQN